RGTGRGDREPLPSRGGRMRRARIPAVALAVTAVLAGAPAAYAITLEQCIGLARRNAPAHQVSEAGVSRADQAIREARAALSPTLRVAGSAIERSESPKFIIPVPGSP